MQYNRISSSIRIVLKYISINPSMWKVTAAECTWIPSSSLSIQPHDLHQVTDGVHHLNANYDKKQTPDHMKRNFKMVLHQTIIILDV